MEAWEALGRPHVMWIVSRVSAAGLALERAWVTRDGEVGADLVPAPLSNPLSDNDPRILAESLVPDAVVASLERGGVNDDLVVVAPDALRAIAWPMLPLADHADERLNSFAAVTLLPSLSWGVHVQQRLAQRQRDRLPAPGGPPPGADSPPVVAYLHPGLGLDRVELLLASPLYNALRVAELPEFGDALKRSQPWMALIAAHGSLTADGSVDLRDHRGQMMPPESLLTWPVPPVALIAGCRTAASNAVAPLHLAEAALIAGASHVIAATGRTTDTVVDQVVATVLRLLMPTSGEPSLMGPSQALQSALQQIDRAWPYPGTDLTGWPLVHIGLPSSAEPNPARA
jgi:hypothetical protein